MASIVYVTDVRVHIAFARDLHIDHAHLFMVCEDLLLLPEYITQATVLPSGVLEVYRRTREVDVRHVVAQVMRQRATTFHTASQVVRCGPPGGE